MAAIKQLPARCNRALVLISLCISQGSALSIIAQSKVEIQIRGHFQAAREAEKSGDLEKAASEYKAVLQVQPDEPVVYNNLGLVYHLQARYRDAIEVFQRAVQLNPGLLGANLLLGIDYYRTNQPEKGLEPLRKASAANPKDLQAHLYLGRCYLDLG